MRCPYCGGLNPDRTQYCIRCGREMTVQPASTQRQPQPQPQPQPSSQQQRPPYQSPPRSTYPQPTRPTYPPPANPQPAPVQAPPYQRPGQTPPAPPSPLPQPSDARATRRRAPVASQVVPPLPPAPEPPAPFPPRTVEHLKALTQGALNYTIITDDSGYGKKKIVRVLYQRCVAWQQMATLMKAFKDYDTSKSDTIIIQGVFDAKTDVYEYTNGQLVFDRNTRLGSQTLNRYQIETDNGFSGDSVRAVVTEQVG